MGRLPELSWGIAETGSIVTSISLPSNSFKRKGSPVDPDVGRSGPR